MAAILGEVAGRLPRLGAVDVPSIYFGGGTPSTLNPEQVRHILAGLAAEAHILEDAEITIEANPGAIDGERAAGYRQAGVNRLSLGIQSLDDDMLAALGRIHTAEEALAAYHAVRDAGFANVSIDLMFGVPGQSLDLWRETLAHAIDLGSEHISLYCLTIEPGTPFAERHDHEELFPGESNADREDREADMFELAIDTLEQAGYAHYEIANFARPGYECRHNAVYWRNEPYIGFGPSAQSYLPTPHPPLCERVANVSDIDAYIELARRQGSAMASRESLSVARALGESIMLGLRMMAGVDLSLLATRWGIDPREHFAAEIARLLDRGLIERDGNTIRLTRPGLLLADEAMQLFV